MQSKDMNLLLFNLKTDIDDPILGFTTKWINSIAKNYKTVDVITMCTGKVSVPENVRVYSIGKEKGYSEFRRLLNFYKILFKLLREKKYTGCFSHMTPIFSVFGSPLLKMFKIPIITWYAHRQLGVMLKLSHLVSNRVVSVNKKSYPYKKDEKFIGLGHGIDIDHFDDNNKDHDKGKLLYVGRISPLKNIETIIKSFKKIVDKGFDVQLYIVGDSPNGEKDYISHLKELINELSLNTKVIMTGSLIGDELLQYYRSSYIKINASPADHSVDKVSLEAMASGCICLSSVKALKETYGEYYDMLSFKFGDNFDLSNKIENILKLKKEKVKKITCNLKKNILLMHNLEGLSEKLVKLFKDIK